ncbi:MAG: UDP-2,3-diacylglucosamine diphosphatase [Legionellaceae bacterium]|nr:UDP-2,3-diacylglucosamine diphosphatase [Legionellaceae bacterium]
MMYDVNEAVFISDLHLHPDMPEITQQFYEFIKWAAVYTKNIYILGDFFHVWPGDDAIDEWSGAIADQLAWLAAQGVAVYFMHGNRDFLLGNQFFARANLRKLPEASVIKLGQERVAVVHGDCYCTHDTGHQWLRRLTRNKLFSTLFLTLPYTFRARIVQQVRQYSQTNRSKPLTKMEVVVPVMLRHLRRLRVHQVIHGHIHQPGLNLHTNKWGNYKQYVLSDWDEKPTLVCYNKSNKFHFIQFGGFYGS